MLNKYAEFSEKSHTKIWKSTNSQILYYPNGLISYETKCEIIKIIGKHYAHNWKDAQNMPQEKNYCDIFGRSLIGVQANLHTGQKPGANLKISGLIPKIKQYLQVVEKYKETAPELLENIRTNLSQRIWDVEVSIIRNCLKRRTSWPTMTPDIYWLYYTETEKLGRITAHPEIMETEASKLIISKESETPILIQIYEKVLELSETLGKEFTESCICAGILHRKIKLSKEEIQKITELLK